MSKKVPRWPTRKAEPTGTSPAFGTGLDGACLGIIEVPTYAKTVEGRMIRETRRELRIGLRRGADLLGLAVVELGELERGVSVLVDPSDAEKIIHLLTGIT